MKKPATAKTAPTDFKAWKAKADEILARQDIRPSVMRHRDWVKAFTSGATPEEAAKTAGTHDYNRRNAARLGKR